MPESFMQALEDALDKGQLKDLKRGNYKSENRLKTFSHDGKNYSVLQSTPLSNMVLYKLRKNAEEKWNDGFSVIKYDEDPIKHSIEINEKLQGKINIPKLANDKIKDTYLEDKLIITEIPTGMIDAVNYSKNAPKTLATYIGESLSKMHNENIAYKDPSIYTLNVVPNKGIVAFNNFAFAQPIEKPEDKARDVMQFLISIHYNSKESIQELTRIFSIFYKKESNSSAKSMKEAMKNVIEYDLLHKSSNPARSIYQWTVFGVGQDKMIELKKEIEKNYMY